MNAKTGIVSKAGPKPINPLKIPPTPITIIVKQINLNSGRFVKRNSISWMYNQKFKVYLNVIENKCLNLKSIKTTSKTH